VSPRWLRCLPAPENSYPGVAAVFLGQWDSARQHIADRATADTEFHAWFAQSVLAQAAAAGSTPTEVDHELWQILDAMLEICISHDRMGDALLIYRWAADRFVPPGDARACQVISAAAGFCVEIREDLRFRDRAQALVEHVIRIAPHRSSPELNLSVCQALEVLRYIWRSGRDSQNNLDRTMGAIGVCDEIIGRWQNSSDQPLREAVTDARLHKAKDYLEVGEERRARRECASLVADLAEGTAADDHLGTRGFIARHALDMLVSVKIPAPLFRTEFLQYQRRRNLGIRRRDPAQWLAEGAPMARISDYTQVAARLHAASVSLVRRAACFGDPPLVLLLRNFDIVEQSFTGHFPRGTNQNDPDATEQYMQVVNLPEGLALINRVTDITHAVQVASTRAAGMELDWESWSVLGRHSLRPLYLPDDDWLGTVRLLVQIAECVVVWAREKSDGLLRELELLAELGRAGDTVVLLEDARTRADTVMLQASLKGEFGRDLSVPPGPSLTAGDPVLAGFPQVMAAAEMTPRNPDDSPFTRQVMNAVAAVEPLCMAERVQRIQDRMIRGHNTAT
jgi:hypothetical protein